MKFTHLLLGALSIAGRVFANEAAKEAAPESSEVTLKNFNLHYYIEEFSEVAHEELLELYHGEKITLHYTFENREDEPITVVGVGGALRDPLTGEPKINLTANSVEPMVLPPGEATDLRQIINLDFQLGDFVLTPVVYVAFKDELKAVQAKAQLTTLRDPPVSFFNPQFLFLEFVLLALFGSLGYYLYNDKLQAYLKQTEPVTKAAEVSGGSTSYDPNWIPAHHQAINRGQKVRKY